jgi:hypothetical protein
VEAMRRYDRAGRDCWRPFMRTHGATGGASPVDSRLLPGDRERAAAAGGLA